MSNDHNTEVKEQNKDNLENMINSNGSDSVHRGRVVVPVDDKIPVDSHSQDLRKTSSVARGSYSMDKLLWLCVGSGVFSFTVVSLWGMGVFDFLVSYFPSLNFLSLVEDYLIPVLVSEFVVEKTYRVIVILSALNMLDYLFAFPCVSRVISKVLNEKISKMIFGFYQNKFYGLGVLVFGIAGVGISVLAGCITINGVDERDVLTSGMIMIAWYVIFLFMQGNGDNKEPCIPLMKFIFNFIVFCVFAYAEALQWLR